jgi:[ribosomal protein S18]-alanine N-acetyltransferase
VPRPRFHIRDFRREDLDTLWRIDAQCFPPDIAYPKAALRYYVSGKHAFTLVAERGKEIVGFLIGDWRGDIGHITTIDVLAPARRSGLGAELMRLAEERLRAAGCRSLTLETAVDNMGAISFYQRLGYSLVRSLPRYYSSGVDGLLLRKTLR